MVVDEAAAPGWARALDGLLEGGVYAFAAWTVWYEVALVTQWSLWWPARVWLVVAAALLGWRAAAHVRRPGRPERRERCPQPEDQERPERREPPNVRERPARGGAAGPVAGEPEARRGRQARSCWWQAGAVLLAAVALVALSALRESIGVLPVVVLGMAVLLVGCVQLGVRARRAPLPRDVSPASHVAHLAAALVCLAMAVLAAGRPGSSGDDVYYVNRATWVAQRGTPTLRDSLFGTGALPTIYGGGLPLASIEGWQGAVARVLGVQAPEFVFVWTVPVLAAAAGWGMWRLVRTWATRRTAVAFLVATAFTFFSADSVVGHYGIGAIWEGKVAAVAVVVPLAWHHLTGLALRPRPADLLVLFALGTCFVGLTSSAALMAPVMAAGALLAAALLRSWPCVAGALCFALAPVAAGVASVLGPGLGGAAPTALPPVQVFAYLFGVDTVMVALGVLGIVLGPRALLAPAAVVAGCASLSGLAAVLPGVGDAVNALTGAGPVAWRVVLAIPVAVLVGMLVTIRPPPVTNLLRRRRALDLVTAVAACAIVTAVIARGTPLWSPRGDALDFGAWKLDPGALADVRSVLPLATSPGPWLLPPGQMEVLAMTTTEHQAVVPRAYYLTGLPPTQADVADRALLFDLVAGHDVAPEAVSAALHHLQVSLACVGTDDPRAVRLLARVVGSPLEAHGSMLCHVG
ncbi:DUF6077 domain-containing protein [Terrabacter sp. NPDC080008]|uniref:DUF6077 domain-containing protein n=1 Tax=Terrabacter sp. NPDC080008 TaxID=3155176 RepID=UPI00344D18A8